MKAILMATALVSSVFASKHKHERKHELSTQMFTGLFTRDYDNCLRLCHDNSGGDICGKNNWDCCENYGC